MKIILVRHGQTVANAENRIQGHLDTELSPLGLRQAEIVADALADEDVEAVYSSDCQRASVTAEIIARRHHHPVAVTPLLREACLGVWQGLTIDEIMDRYPQEYEAWRRDSIASRPPGGERLESVIARVRRFLVQIIRNDHKGSIIVVGHGGSIRAAICCVMNSGPLPYRHVRLDNAGLTTLEWSLSEPPMLLGINDTCHLRSAEGLEALAEI